MKFDGKVALVTGGSRGIGETIVKELSENGAVVYFTYVNHTLEFETKMAFWKENQIYPIQCDVSDYETVKKAAAKIISNHHKIDFVVNNAGITRDKSLALMSPEDWEDVIRVNLGGTFNICRSVILSMMKQKSGKIINISSVSGLIGWPYQCNYAASKAGIIGFSKSLAKEVAGHGITVNVIAPGFVETDMVSKLKDNIRAKSLEAIPLKRFGLATEIAAMASFLLSENAGYITGEVFKVDGGIAM